MALRVLLADRSEEIRHVMQKSLQDFGVEVQTVDVGTDVIEVAKRFLPDVIFLDVLLQKKSGYEVSSLIKTDPQLRSIPVLLLWSEFVPFDDSKAKASMADGRLEKPFDSETLRQTVIQLVPKTRQPGIHQHLAMPFIPKPNLPQPQQNTVGKVDPSAATIVGRVSTHEPTKAVPTSESASVDWNMDQFEPLPDLELQIPKDQQTNDLEIADLSDKTQPFGKSLSSFPQHTQTQLESDDDLGDWKKKDLSSIQVNIPAGAESGEMVLDTDMLQTLKDDYKPSESIELNQPLVSDSAMKSTASAGSTVPRSDFFSPLEMEQYLKNFLAENAERILMSYLEKTIQDQVPHLAEKVIRQEIQKLLGDQPRADL